MGKSEDLIHSMAIALINGSSVREAYEELKKTGLKVSPGDVFKAMHRLMKDNGGPEKMLPYVDKVMNLLHAHLSEYEWNRPQEDSFLYQLMEDNRNLVQLLDRYRDAARAVDSIDKAGWMDFTRELMTYGRHLQQLENILFPELEKTDEMFDGLSMLWGMHDRARQLLKEASLLFSQESAEVKDYNEMIGKLYFMFHGLVKKQELILFPLAATRLDEEVIKKMKAQSMIWKTDGTGPTDENSEFRRNALDIDQLDAIIRSLPFDITFVDDADEVAFFSEGDRIFPRSASVIGRKVQNCHPPKSLEAVESILKGFRENRSSQEEFWIDHHGKKVLIKYIAVRDEAGKYLGTLEITQDITQIQRLEGEKRL